jgi:hypothetical protein
MFFDELENQAIAEKPKINYDERDSELIEKFRNNEINVEETVRSLEKLYKGNNKKNRISYQIYSDYSILIFYRRNTRLQRQNMSIGRFNIRAMLPSVGSL